MPYVVLLGVVVVQQGCLGVSNVEVARWLRGESSDDFAHLGVAQLRDLLDVSHQLLDLRYLRALLLALGRSSLLLGLSSAVKSNQSKKTTQKQCKLFQ